MQGDEHGRCTQARGEGLGGVTWMGGFAICQIYQTNANYSSFFFTETNHNIIDIIRVCIYIYIYTYTYMYIHIRRQYIYIYIVIDFDHNDQNDQI